MDGVTVQNTVGLCVACHLAVTGDIGGHRAHIRYDADRGLFEWWAKGIGDDWFFVGHLKRHGLVDGQPEAKRIRRDEGLCPECGHPLKTHGPSHPPGPKRKVATWGVVVPADEEVGSDQLDEWVDSSRPCSGSERHRLGCGDTTSSACSSPGPRSMRRSSWGIWSRRNSGGATSRARRADR